MHSSNTSSISLTMIKMARFHIKTSIRVWDLKSTQERLCISDKTNHTWWEWTSVSIINVGNLLKDMEISANYIIKCT